VPEHDVNTDMGASWVAEPEVATAYGPSALRTPANFVTVTRLLVSPILFGLIADEGASWVTFWLWVALAATDGVDGWIARRHGVTSAGAFLDPLADKVLVLGAMFTLVARDVFPIVPVLIIAAREFVISVYRTVVGSKGVSVPASRMAKYKTLFQQLAVGFALWPWFAVDATWLWMTLLWIAVVLALVSGAQYLRRTHAEVADGAIAKAV
jgi:CDP-diacylglycerol--glycerol-3-phosphate 3-phosphatidyltransferase